MFVGRNQNEVKGETMFFIRLFDVVFDIIAQVKRVAHDKSKNYEQQGRDTACEKCVWRDPKIG